MATTDQVVRFLAENPLYTQLVTVPVATLVSYPLVKQKYPTRDNTPIAADVAIDFDLIEGEQVRQMMVNNCYRAVLFGVPLGVIIGLGLTVGARRAR